MNKYQEAIKRVELDFEDRIEQDNVGMVGRIDIERLQELVDKATPKKPGIVNAGQWFYYCSKCDDGWFIKGQKFCQECGQALDWSEDE